MPDRSLRTPAPFALSHREVDSGTSVVAVTGDLDLTSAPRLKAALLELYETGRTRLVLEMSGAPFMDSTALGVLIGFRRLIGAEGAVALAGASAPIVRVLEVTGVDRTFELFPTVDEAIAHVQRVSAGQHPGADEQTAAPTREPAFELESVLEGELRSDDLGSVDAALTGDSAVVLGIAMTAIPFARTAEDQAEGWLRALRRTGDAAIVLSSLGISDERADGVSDDGTSGPSASKPPRDVVSTITRRAGQMARRRGDSAIRPIDLLAAVLEVYGQDFERVLERHGVDPVELVQQLDHAVEQHLA